MLSTTSTVPTSAFQERTGWEFKPEGACKGHVCIPLEQPPGDTVELEDMARALGLPIVVDDEHGLWAVGPESTNGHVLTTAVAPELVLPTLDGQEFRLSSLRGKKVLLVAWAPY